MKKWLITTLLVIACVFGLVACGSSDNSNAASEVELTDEQKQQWFDSASQFVLSMHDVVQSGQAEAQMDDPVYGPAFTSWQNALGRTLWKISEKCRILKENPLPSQRKREPSL